jgi:hypothetical protein
MLTNLTSQPEKVITRKEARKARMAGMLQAASLEALQASLNLSDKRTVWVYLNTPLGGKATYFHRVSRLPEVPFGSPTATLKLVAGFQKGKKVLG